MHKEKEKDGILQVMIRTNGHEGFGVEAGLRQADAVDCEHPHLIQDAFNHPLSLVCSGVVNVEVEFCPSRGAFLLPLHEVTWGERVTA